jgi:hypothetical protein
MTPTDPILSPEQIKRLRDGYIAGYHYVLDSHEALRARVAALEAEREQLAKTDLAALINSVPAREASAYARGRESGKRDAIAVWDYWRQRLTLCERGFTHGDGLAFLAAMEAQFAWPTADPPTRVPPGATPR